MSLQVDIGRKITKSTVRAIVQEQNGNIVTVLFPIMLTGLEIYQRRKQYGRNSKLRRDSMAFEEKLSRGTKISLRSKNRHSRGERHFSDNGKWTVSHKIRRNPVREERCRTSQHSL
jgi:hypothetical protein